MTETSSSSGSTGTRNTHTLALLAVACAVLTWGGSSIIIKLVSASGLVTSFYRLWLAIPLLWLTALGTSSIRQRLDRTWMIACLRGGSLFGLHQIFFFNCLKLTSVANVTIIGALQPALVLLVAGRLFGEWPTRRALIWSAVALSGTVIVVSGSSGTSAWSPLGDTLAVANLFIFTAYFLVSKEIRSRVGALEYVVGITTVAGIVVLAASLATGQDLGAPRGWDWPLLIALAALPGTLGHFLTNWAHRHTSAFVMSMMLLAVPVIGSIGAALLLDETLGPAQITGGTIVLVAIGIVVRSTHVTAREHLGGGAAPTDTSSRRNATGAS